MGLACWRNLHVPYKPLRASRQDFSSSALRPRPMPLPRRAAARACACPCTRRAANGPPAKPDIGERTQKETLRSAARREGRLVAQARPVRGRAPKRGVELHAPLHAGWKCKWRIDASAPRAPRAARSYRLGVQCAQRAGSTSGARSTRDAENCPQEQCSPARWGRLSAASGVWRKRPRSRPHLRRPPQLAKVWVGGWVGVG